MRLHKLDLNLLVVLDIILAERSVSQTAQILHLTQPAISNALSRLRTHFNDELLLQVGRRMVPTPFAENLAPAVHNALAELSKIATSRFDFDPMTVERSFKIACSDFVFQVFLAPALRTLAQEAPGVRITTLLTSEQSADLLHQGMIDFVIAPSVRVVPDHPSTPLFSERFSCIAWTGNPLVGGALTREKYNELEHVSTCLGPSNPPHVEQTSLDAQGVTRRIAIYAPNFTSVAEAIIGTNYIATVHARLAELMGKRLPIRVFPPPFEIAPFTEVIQWHKSNSTDLGLVWLRDFLVRSANAL